MVPTSTRAHDTQPIPPQKNLTIRGSTSPAAAQKYVTNTHQDAPPYRAAPQKTPHPTPRLKRRQWARSSPQHTRKKDMPNPPPRRNRLATNQRAQTVVHYTPNTPCHPHTTEVDCTLSNHSGGFATIDPRHAGDTPQGSAYGSNSPQATNEHKPHHHDKHTKTSRTRPTQPPKEHTKLALPSNHGGFCDHRPPTRRRHAATQRLW